MSLLAGTLAAGTAADEKRAFVAQPSLVSASAKLKPVLFHKAELVGPDGSALSDAVRAAIDDPTQRVVGVVVNAIDDHLSNGSQVMVPWTLGTIRYLGELMDHARDAGRIVIITADHGHVLDSGRSIARDATGSLDRGDRWRTPHQPAGDGEIEVRGARVVGGGGHVVLAVDDRVRYGGKKHGYHGGLTPQEVLVPLAVLSRADTEVAGWRTIESFEPWWWEPGSLPPIDAPADPVVEAVPEKPSKAKRAKVEPPTPSLFVTDDQPAEGTQSAGDWITQLLASPTFVSNRPTEQRNDLADDRIRAFLRSIKKRGFVVMRDVLMVDIGGQPAKIRLELGRLRQLLNIEGYEALTLEGDSVKLNVELLASQFGVSIEAIRGRA